MINTLEILDNYLERAVKGDLIIIGVLEHIFLEETFNKRKRAFDFTFQPSIDKGQIDE